MGRYIYKEVKLARKSKIYTKKQIECKKKILEFDFFTA